MYIITWTTPDMGTHEYVADNPVDFGTKINHLLSEGHKITAEFQPVDDTLCVDCGYQNCDCPDYVPSEV